MSSLSHSRLHSNLQEFTLTQSGCGRLQASAKAELAAVEREFSEYRAAQRNTPEADLVRQLADANEQVRRAEGKAEKAVAAKQGYKEQVCPHLSVCLSVCCQQSYKEKGFAICLPAYISALLAV